MWLIAIGFTLLGLMIGYIIGGREGVNCRTKDIEETDDFNNLVDYASEKEKMLLQPIITNNDTPKIISNGDGSFHSDERIEGKSYGTLALSDEERVSFAEGGWHDTGLVNGHGQPLVQNEKGEILSVCRYVGHEYNYMCNAFVAK